ncbi:MAG: hypothetical protein GQ565_03890 [Candidatus Aegiribacteria sp.]|nr:hypothetical protein [Candidatus Aegiribacteria sp.]
MILSKIDGITPAGSGRPWNSQGTGVLSTHSLRRRNVKIVGADSQRNRESGIESDSLFYLSGNIVSIASG